MRWVSYDRPGYGGSTPHPGRDVASAAADVASVADALGCAALLPDRVLAAVCGSGLAPYHAEGLDCILGGRTSATPPPRGAIPRSKQGNPPRHLGLGLRPRQPGPCCIYGLEVRLAPSAWCRPGASPQVESGPPSGQSHPGRRCDNDRIAKGIARSSVKQRARQAWLQSPVRKRSASMRVNLWPGPSRRIGWPACHEEAAVADSGSRSIAPTRKQRAPSAVKALAAARSTTPPVAGTT
jgi:hypothetical protein